MSLTNICTAEHLHHTCIAVRDIEKTLEFYKNLFGLDNLIVEDVPDQGVKAALINIGGSQLELIQPTNQHGSIARFIEQRGESLHHICFEVDNLKETLDLMASNGIKLVDKVPRQGLAGMIAFLHPHSTQGVLIELVDRDTARR